MNKHCVTFIITLLFLSGCGIKHAVRFDKLPEQPIPQISRELRGIWVTRFNWVHTDPDTMKNLIIQIMEQSARDNFNAVFFQVRGQAETLYSSPFEAWSKLVNARDPGFDPVQLAVQEAHRHGLKFYAYINLMPLWNEDTPPADPDHLYFKHGPQVDPDSSWLCFDEDGKPMKRNEYFYMNPALPEVKTYLKQVIRHFVTTYNIDGLHFDRIRYPGPNYLNDPYSLKHFRADSLQAPVTKDEWARQQLTNLVEDVVADALLIKPYLVISAATWGMYRTDDVDNYDHFGSGYHNYYQDAIDWLDRGIMDFIVPMIYWDINDPLPNFHELWLDFKKRTPNYHYIFPGMRVWPKWLANGETASQINFVRQNSGNGTVMFAYSSLQGEGHRIIQDIIYPQKIDLPENLKRTKAEQVVGLNLRHLLSDTPGGRSVVFRPDGRRKQTDTDGNVSFILTKKPAQLQIKTENADVSLDTHWWQTPFKYTVQPDSSVNREEPWVEFRRMPDDTTTNPEFHMLFKTGFPARASINGDSAKVYKTGIFFNKIELAEGANRVKAQIITEDSTEAMYEREFFYKKVDKIRKSFPLWIDERSVRPDVDLIVLQKDAVRISFTGSKGQQAFAEIQPGKIKLTFSRKDFSDYSLYQTGLPLRLLKKRKQHFIKLILKSTPGASRKEKYELPLKTSITVSELDQLPLLKTTQHNSILSYNLGKIRLGSPIIAEYEPGVVLKSSGIFGKHYRIYLNQNEEGFIHQDYVDELPKGSVQPSFYLQSIFCAPSDAADIVRIPYPQAIPYAVYPEPDQKRIIISLYGAKTSSTWITHRKDRKIIEKVTWKQITPETYQVIVNLKTAKIWGYEIKTEGSSLMLRIKYPPLLSRQDSTQTLSGLKIAIEAGHGGRSLGAIGLSGLFEKDINLDLATKLAKVCQKKGLEVLLVREQDESMSLTTKRDAVENSDAHLLVSIHANSGGLWGGYLRVGGTSTYYNNPFWAKFAEIVYSNLLKLELDEFGVIGSFNYKVTRMASRPAILVEQAFLSHAEDEEKLADDSFRQKMAERLYDGIVEYIKYMIDE